MNTFKTDYPDFATIEAHIRRARVERSVAIAQFLAEAIMGAGRGLKQIGAAIANIKVGKATRPVVVR